MMYLFLTFIFLFISFYLLYSTTRLFLSGFYAKQNFYSSINNKSKIFIMYLIKYSNIFIPIFKNIKLKPFIEYTNKLDDMLKIFDFDNIKINSYNFIFIQIIALIIGCFISVIVFGFDIFFMVCIGLLFLILPYLKLCEQYNKRINNIIKQLPDVANLLAIMIYSGIDFNNAINRIIFILEGDLISELKNIIDKVSLGIDIKIAFKELAGKYNIVGLRTFVKAITISLNTGTGLTEGLNKIAQQITNDNVQIAEKKAHEAPVKMLIPMTILIIPTIFILLFAPFVISFFKSGSLL